MPTPPHTYWVEPGKLLAGCYPGLSGDGSVPELLPQLLDLGMNYFLDLTEPYENGTLPYTPWLRKLALERGMQAKHVRMPIIDFDVPSEETMENILATLDAALADGRRVYVHCFAGLGRAATVAACYLVRHGMHPDFAMHVLRAERERPDVPDELLPIVEEQRALVRSWTPLAGE